MKDLKTSIWKTIICSLLLILTLFSCEVYESPTYPTLDGTYVVSQVSVVGSNKLTSEILDTSYVNHGEVFSLNNPQGYLDTMNIGTTLYSFDGSQVYAGYYLIGGGDEWVESHHYNVSRDFYTGEYRTIEIMAYGTKRIYTIVADGVDYLRLKSTAQWVNVGPEGASLTHTIYLERVGP